MATSTAVPTLAVWKFASCDGCQLSLLDCEDELLSLVTKVHIAHFLEASSATEDGPYDVSLVEGSVTTPSDVERIHRIRAQSRVLVTIGACATAGGVQALRDFADVQEFRSVVYAKPEFVATLARSTPISVHVAVDHELRGCPINRAQLLELLGALLTGRRPNLPTHSVCYECKQRGATCLLVSARTPCLGPVTQAGCGAICPAYGRGCYGCFGPVAGANTGALAPTLRLAGLRGADLARAYRTFNAAAPAFTAAADAAAAESTTTGEAGDDPPQ
jgi:coenzyme F420-reducing hydrogenase gamma subunit